MVAQVALVDQLVQEVLVELQEPEELVVLVDPVVLEDQREPEELAVLAELVTQV